MKTTLKLLSFFLVITLLGCEENNYYTIIEDKGKESIYIEGNLTNDEAAAQLADELGPNTQNIFVQNTTQLTAISINSATNIRNIVFGNNQKLTNITISGFKRITELLFNENITKPYPTTPIILNCNDIEEVISKLELRLYYSTPGATVNFNKLKSVGTEGFILWAKASVLNFPLLESVDTFSFAVAKNIITFPSLKHINYFGGPAVIEFNQLNFPVLEYCKEFEITPYEHINSAQVNLPNLNYCERFRLNRTLQSSNEVNAILNQFLNVLPVSGKLIAARNYYGTIIPPTGQGIIDRQTLIDQGNTVATDGSD